MNLEENGLALWTADVKELLGADLIFYASGWNTPTFKINDIEITIPEEQYHEMFTINLPNYSNFGKTLVDKYNRLKHIQDMVELSDAGIGCA